MATRTSDRTDGQPISRPDYDRYSHVKTEHVDIIYDTESENAWIQATSSVHLEEWR